jgi:eukaryotic-like serine/threonine-protein kinase
MISRVSFTALLLLGGCAEPLPPATRATILLPSDRALSSFAISTDGRWVAYSAESAGSRRLFIQSADGSTSGREVTGADGASLPFFSPDTTQIGYFANGWIWRIPVDGGGSPQQVTRAESDSAGATWTADGRIVFAPLGRSGLVEVAAAGGSTSALTSLDPSVHELEHGWPHALPDGSVIFTVSRRSRDPHVELLTSGGRRKRLRVPVFGQAMFLESGHLAYSYLGNLMAVRFDLEAQDIIGVPVPIARGIQTIAAFGTLGRSGLAVSRSGTLVWVRASGDDVRSRLVRVDRDGKVSPLAVPADVYQTPRLSPGRKHIALVVRSAVMTRDIRVVDADPPHAVRSTISGGDNQSPAWMEDGRLSFGSNRDGAQKIYVAMLAKSARAVPLFDEEVLVARNPASWARPPRLLALYEIEQASRRNVLVYRVGESVAPVAATDANERAPAVSADGRWLAYVSDVTGRDEVYAMRLDAVGAAVQVTTDGGHEPVWSRAGLYYRQGERMMVREWRDGTLAPPRTLFSGYFERDPGGNLPAYDVDADGRVFLMLKSASNPRELRVVRNWSTEVSAVLTAGF